MAAARSGRRRAGETTVAQAELRRLLGRGGRGGRRAQLAGQPDLAEAGQRGASVAAGDAPGRAGDRQRDGEVGPRLVDAHAADDVDEDVAVPTPTPAWRPSTASTSARRLRSMPLHTRRGGTSSLCETSAWTSTSSGREPSIAARTTCPAPGGLADEARAGVEDLDEPALAHLEDADLVGRAEAVLQRAQRAVGALALALELQDAVDEVLEHARAGQRALLGHVADEQDRRALRLATR